MHVSSAFVLQGKGRYSGMSINCGTKSLCIIALKYEPQHASILRIKSHYLMFICGIYKKNIKDLCEIVILLRKTKFVECNGMHSVSFTTSTALG